MSQNIFFVVCPHCNSFVEINVNEINCAIFRHGIFKDTLLQMDPHTPKHMCDKFREYNLIYGCGKPFRLIVENNIYTAIKCDYI